MHGDFVAEYEPDIRLDSIARSILLVPYILNVAPIAWFSGRRWSVPELDERLAAALPVLRAGLARLYPDAAWAGEIVAERTVSAPPSPASDAIALLFSGGLDSTYASVATEQPQLLISVRGADIALENAAGWETTLERTRAFADQEGHRATWVASNFRSVLRHDRLNAAAVAHDWWGQVQHGFALTGLTAPVLAHHSIGEVMLSASLAPGRPSPWGSHPELDRHIAWGGGSVRTQGEDIDRQGKLRAVLGHPRPLFLRVCWASQQLAGHNCCECEKCLATAAGLMVEGCDPARHGFERAPDEMIAAIRRRFRRHSMEVASDCQEARWDAMRGVARVRASENGASGHPYPELVEFLTGLRLEGYRSRRALKEKAMVPVRRLGLR